MMSTLTRKSVAAKLLCLLLALQLCMSPLPSQAKSILNDDLVPETEEGASAETDTADVNAAATLRILANPGDFTGEIGETVSMIVVASGDDLAYQWQYSKDNGSTWKNCKSGGYNTDTFSFVLAEAYDGRMYRCIVSDGAGNKVTSAAARVTVASSFAIISHPENVSAVVGETASLHVEATGSDLTYQWQYRKSSTAAWTNCKSGGYNTDTFSFTVKETLDGRQYRCAVTSNGETIYSNTAVVTVLSDAAFEITEQPESTSGTEGDKISLHVAASGSNVTYQWQYSKDGGKTWTNCKSAGCTSDTFSFIAKESLNGRRYRCAVTCNGETIYSNVAVVTVLAAETFEITEQPEDFTGEPGDKVTLHVAAEGSNLAYQWQFSTDDGTTWKNCGMSGSTTDTFSFTMKVTYDGRLFRCKITSGSRTLLSDAAKVSVSKAPVISVQPEDITGKAGDQVSLHIEAEGTGLTYQWQYSTNGGSTWKNCKSAGYNTDTFSFTLTDALNGRMYRCEVKNAAGTSVLTDEITVTVESSYVVDHVIYELIDDVMTVTGYEGTYSTYTVVETVAGHTVKKIGESAFEGNTDLESITLPSTIEVIGKRAFAGCTNLKSMN